MRRLPAGVWVALLVLAFAAFGGVRAAKSRHVGGDFLRYHRAGRLVATGRTERIYDPEALKAQDTYAEERAADRAVRGEKADEFEENEFKYAPALAVMLAPLGSLHPRTGWIVWGAWNGALIALTFAAAWCFAARGSPARWLLVPVVVLAHVTNSNHNLGQLNPSAIAPATIALWALDRRRDRLAGAAAAFGTAVKFLPGLLLVWFAWKRRWSALAALLGGVVLLGAALPAAVLGPARSVELAEVWLEQRAHVYTEAAPPDLPGHSVKSFVYRVLGGTEYRTGTGAKRIEWDVSVARVDPAVLQFVSYGLIALLLVVVLAVTWGPLRAGDDPRGPPEAALFVVWMLLASPEARAPHFLYLALPVCALTVLLVRAWRDAHPRRVLATVLGALGTVLVNTDSESLFGRELANRLAAYCALGWGSLLLAAALLLVLPKRTEAAPAA